MRIAFVTDQHFDSSSRFAETIRIHDWIAEDAGRRGCELTLLGGDLFERKSNIPERDAVAKWLISMAELGPVFGVYGNHEHRDDLEIHCHLESRHGIEIYSRPIVRTFRDLAVACLPWPRKANLHAQFAIESSEQGGMAASECLRMVMRGLGEQLDSRPDHGRIGLMHVMIDGAKTDHDQPIVGADMAVSLADLSLLRAGFYACGHVHAQQEYDIDGAPAIYGGAPRHNNFGEPGPKGYTVIEFDGSRLVGWERVPTPATPMVLLYGAFIDGEIVLAEECKRLADECPPAEIRLRYRVATDQREAARAAADAMTTFLLEKRDAISVKAEPEVITEQRARAPEIIAAKTLREKVECLWTSKGFDPGERREALFAKLRETEESSGVAV